MESTNTNPFTTSELKALESGSSSRQEPTLYHYTAEGGYDYAISRGAGIALFKEQCEKWSVPLCYTDGKRAGSEQKLSDANHQFRKHSPIGRAIALFFAHKDDEALSEWKFIEVEEETETEEEGE